MLTTIKALSAAALSAVLLCVFAADGWAQSGTSPKGYGAAQIASFQSRASTARFSVGNIQATLNNRSVAPAGVQGVNRRNFLSTSSNSVLTQGSKPFSGVNRGPTVSPYLSLSSPRASASDYQSIIRPMQQQQRADERQQAIAFQQQRRLNQIAARAPYSATGDENSAPTGHAAVFQSLGSYQNTGNYFPPPSPPKQR